VRKPFLILWICIAALILFSWVYLPTLSRYRDLKTKLEEMDRQLSDLESRLKDIREERDLLKNDVGYLEKVIRDEMGLVKPGEIIYKFVQDNPKAITASGNDIEALSSKTKFTDLPSKQTATSEVAKKTEASATSTPATPAPAVKKTSTQTARRTSTAAASSRKVRKEPVYPRQETR